MAELDYNDSESDLDVEEKNEGELHGVSSGFEREVRVVRPLNENNYLQSVRKITYKFHRYRQV